MRKPYWMLVAAVAGTGWSAHAENADSAEEIRLLKDQVQLLTRRISELERRQSEQPPAISTPAGSSSLEAIEQQVKVLERQREIDQEAATEKAKTTPVVSLGANGFSVRSPDTNFVFRVRGYIQADGRWFLDDAGSGGPNDTFLLRRVRPILEGSVFDRFDYRLMLDFGSGQSSSANNIGWVQDAYVNARIFPEFQVRVGKDKAPVGLERLQSGANLLFIERAFPTLLVPNRDLGIQFRGEMGEGLFEYQVGVFNGVPDGGSGDADRSDENMDFVGRVFTQPFKNTDSFVRGLGIGIAGSYGDQQGPLRGYFTPAQQTIFSYLTGSGSTTSPNISADGVHWRIAPQLWFYRGPFGLLAEYVISDQDLARTAGTSVTRTEAANHAWQVAASYFLTGEENSFKAVPPRQPFSFSGGGWGAFELAARVSQLDIDDGIFPEFANPDQTISGALEWAIGLNWHLNRNVKLQFNYSQTEFDGAEKNSLAQDGERAFLGRVQFGF